MATIATTVQSLIGHEALTGNPLASGERFSESLINKLMAYSINTGALTSICAIVCLIVYASMPNSFVFLAFYFVLPKLCLNSLLATLNARNALKTSLGSKAILSLPSYRPPMQSWNKSPLTSGSESDDQTLQIAVETTTEKAIAQTTSQDEEWMARLSQKDNVATGQAF
ncbi:hypothetical protein NLI96_g9457 [Meripilus lineatus]|uniref:DUF6534 domain-containing protein n=1 Tax=Meripilus lineatus TaxID=2056292 RepID=A0AAD5UVE5_9APHY|nr:hypothetical protein NLI96_g9457 [Physisporinus lineatus]